MIPQESTPIKHTILIEIIAQGRLSYDEVRIACFIMRWSWGFEDKANNRRHDWTKELTISEIAREIKMKQSLCWRTINKMVNDGKLLRDGNKFQFNEHYENWKVSQKVITEPITNNYNTYNKKLYPLLQKVITPITNSYNPDIQEASISKAPVDENALRKDTLKDTNTKISKDTYTRILNFWNSLKIIEHKDTDKLRKKVTASLKVYTPEELEDAFKNYAYILSQPDRFFWSYKWQLKDFLDRGIERFLPVNFREEDYLKRVYKSKAEIINEKSTAVLARIFQEEEEKDDAQRDGSNP
jgi:DNA-binding Lrp family transcriptional regulator